MFAFLAYYKRDQLISITVGLIRPVLRSTSRLSASNSTMAPQEVVAEAQIAVELTEMNPGETLIGDQDTAIGVVSDTPSLAIEARAEEDPSGARELNF